MRCKSSDENSSVHWPWSRKLASSEESVGQAPTLLKPCLLFRITSLPWIHLTTSLTHSHYTLITWHSSYTCIEYQTCYTPTYHTIHSFHTYHAHLIYIPDTSITPPSHPHKISYITHDCAHMTHIHHTYYMSTKHKSTTQMTHTHYTHIIYMSITYYTPTKHSIFLNISHTHLTHITHVTHISHTFQSTTHISGIHHTHIHQTQTRHTTSILPGIDWHWSTYKESSVSGSQKSTLCHDSSLKPWKSFELVAEQCKQLKGPTWRPSRNPGTFLRLGHGPAPNRTQVCGKGSCRVSLHCGEQSRLCHFPWSYGVSGTVPPAVAPNNLLSVQLHSLAPQLSHNVRRDALHVWFGGARQTHQNSAKCWPFPLNEKTWVS